MAAVIVDPELIAEVTRQFNLRGQLKPFNLTEDVVPVFDIGRLIGLAPQPVVTPGLQTMVAAGHSLSNRHYAVAPPRQTGANASGVANNPAAGAIVGDTGQLAAGTHYCVATFSADATTGLIELQHRNAANAADVDLWSFQLGLGVVAMVVATIEFNLNERLRWETAVGFTGNAASNVMAVRDLLDIAV